LNRGFSEKEFKDELAGFIGENMDDFFAKYVNGTEVAPLKETFDLLGINVESVGVSKVSFGATVRNEGGKAMVKGIRAGSSAETAGLSVNDEVIACNGFRVDQKAFDDYVNNLEKGDAFTLLISRDEILMDLEVVMDEYYRPNYSFKITADSKKAGYRAYWLRSL
jgi:predicted metalloprotease with PDZ domain